MKVLLVIVAAIALTSPFPLVDNSIVSEKNETEADPQSLPYQVFLEVYPKSGGKTCSGSLITRNYVLTTAHCVYQGSIVYVTLGVHNLLGYKESRIKLASNIIKIHEDYSDNEDAHDIALIKLPETVPLSDAIQPVQLPKRSDVSNTYLGVTARISGWSPGPPGNYHLSDILTYAEVEVIRNDGCGEDLPNAVLCTSRQLGTGDCLNDGGEPLVYNGVQIGIYEFGWNCELGKPHGFTRVTEYLDWIEDNSDIIIG